MEIKFTERSQSEFNPYRCGNCGRTEQLKLCSSCRLISFCSGDCQKQYWPKHRSLCRVIGKIVTVEKKNSIFEVRKEEISHVGGGEGLLRAIIFLIQNLNELLGRSLTFEETLLLSYPRYCEVCFASDPHKLQRCPDCNFTSFCKTGDCQNRSKSNPNGHHKYCDQKRIAFLCRRDIVYEKVFTELPPPARFEDFLKDNNGLFSLIEQLSQKEFIHNPTTRKEMTSFVTVSQFSFTATILHALSKANLLHPDRESLYIDIVGAKYEETYFSDETCALFYIFMPKLHSLKINLIGPELTPPRIRTEDVNCFGKTTKIGYYKMFYEDFRRGPKPDFIMCFNCGFSETTWLVEEPSWVRGIRKILRNGVPFAFTSYTSSELADEIEFMGRVLDEMKLRKEVTGVFMGDNPFKDLRPFQNFDRFISAEPLFYGNQKLCVMNWKNIVGEEEFERCKALFDRQYQ